MPRIYWTSWWTGFTFALVGLTVVLFASLLALPLILSYYTWVGILVILWTVLTIIGIVKSQSANPTRSVYFWLSIYLIVSYGSVLFTDQIGYIFSSWILCGLLALIIWAVQKRNLRRTTCPNCAESIKVEAKVCRYCGREVDPVIV